MIFFNLKFKIEEYNLLLLKIIKQLLKEESHWSDGMRGRRQYQS